MYRLSMNEGCKVVGGGIGAHMTLGTGIAGLFVRILMVESSSRIPCILVVLLGAPMR